jgi:hypothetical protein
MLAEIVAVCRPPICTGAPKFLQDAVDDRRHVARRDVDQQHRELIAPHARRRVGGTQRGDQTLAHGA